MIRGILTDFGGTVDTDGIHWFRMFREAYSSCGNDLPEDMLRMAYVHAERTLGRNHVIEPSFTFSRTLETKIALQTGFLLSEGVHVTGADAICDFCMDKVRNNVATVSSPVLESLSERYPIVLVTNFYGNMNRVLDELGIARFFKGVVESSVVGVRKPDSRIFGMGCDVLGLHPCDVLMVGDSPDKDIVPAASAGCRTCLLDRGLSFEGAPASDFRADCTIHTFADLPLVPFL